MSDEAPQLTNLGAVTEVITKGTTPTTIGGSFTHEGTAFIKVETIDTDGGIVAEKLAFIDSHTHSLLKRSQLKEHDVLFSIAGVIGRTAIIKQSMLPANTNQAIAILRPKIGLLDPQFLYYYLRSPHFFDYSLGRVVQTAQANVSLSELRIAPIKLPHMMIQRKIAAILSAYDDLIENNTRRIKILEETAQTIYREWFVNFRFPGHEKVRLVNSELGKIPEGWEIRSLGDIADVQWGDTSVTKARYVEVGYDAYSASGLDGLLDYYDFERDGIVLSAIGANCGKTWFASGKWSCIKNTIRFWANVDDVTTEYLYYATSSLAFWPRRGSAQPFISQGDAQNCLILCPDKDMLTMFTEFVDNSLKQIETLRDKNTVLRRTRDLLLPRLISGELDVSDLNIVINGSGGN